MMTKRGDRVALAVEDCVDYWRRTGVPRSTVAGMREELEQHLLDAEAAGKSVESVVGPDVLAFAEEWAREYRPPSAVPRPEDGRGPGILALVTGFLILLGAMGVGAYFEAGSTLESCCPLRVVETGPRLSVGPLVWLGWTLAVAVLCFVAGTVLLRGKLRLGSGLLFAAAPAALITPITIVGTILLLLAGAWAYSRWRRPLLSPPR
jgi:hypothetical protein